MAAAVEVVRRRTPDLLEALQRLLAQLNPELAGLDGALLDRVLSDPAVDLLVARVAGRIVGTLTVAVTAAPDRVTAQVDDVVVDARARRQGVGEALMLAALERARSRGATAVRLTTAEHREAAHRLYERLGFERVESRLYRLRI